MIFKICSKCDKDKPITDFPERKNRKNGVASRCRPCSTIGSRQRHLKFRYGVSDEKYASMFAEQLGRCAICKQEEKRVNSITGELRRLCIDHDHVTGLVRKLLCHDCNFGIGQFSDSPETLRAAAAYLESFKINGRPSDE